MIHARSLVKDFPTGRSETVRAVSDLTLDIEPGELVAVLGPNGAGKTTLIRMLTTLIPPTSGHAQVVGHDVTTQAAQVRRRIGYVGQGNGAGHTQLVGDELRTQGLIYGMGRHDAARRAAALLEDLDLTDLEKRKVSDLSGGQRRRLDVAMGMVHAPSLLFLDEPSTGLDPQSRANLWTHILRLREATGMTIVLTTHYLDEADSMAERVVVVDHGQVIADDTAEALKAELAGDRIRLTAARPDQAGSLATLVQQLAGAIEVQHTGTEVTARVPDGPGVLPHLLQSATAAGVVTTSVDLRRPTLDDVFLTLTGRTLRDTGITSGRPSPSRTDTQSDATPTDTTPTDTTPTDTTQPDATQPAVSPALARIPEEIA